jgi:hypothetical protein
MVAVCFSLRQKLVLWLLFGFLIFGAAAQGDDVDWASDTLLNGYWPTSTAETKKLDGERKHHSILVFSYCFKIFMHFLS